MFCLGAFQDALCLRGQLARKPIPHATTMGSAAQCILLLLGLVVASYGVALVLPGVSLARQSARYRDAPNLMLIRDARYADVSVPTISAEQYRAWKQQRQNLFDGFAFYQLMQQSESSPSGSQTLGRIAVASPNLFELLGLPIRFVVTGGHFPGDPPRLILSDEAWKREFGGDPHISGRTRSEER